MFIDSKFATSLPISFHFIFLKIAFHEKDQSPSHTAQIEFYKCCLGNTDGKNNKKWVVLFFDISIFD